MNLWTKAIIIGVAIEALMLLSTFFIVDGSCKPEGLGLMLLLLQYPALLLTGRLPPWLNVGATFVICSFAWSCVTYAFLRLLSIARK